MSNTESLPLTGLRGDNPLAFLAAVGTLRILSAVWPEKAALLSWTFTDGGWQPALHIGGGCEQHQVLDALQPLLEATATNLPEWKDVPVSVAEFRTAVTQAVRSPTSGRSALDVFGWLGSDATEDRNEGSMTVTRFKMVSGQQSFLGQVRELIQTTERAHLEEALFGKWSYRDRKPSMRWDPADDRRYALRDSDPANTSKNPILTVRGANRLAIEALALYPVIPLRDDSMTCGFIRGRPRWMFTWPIWKYPIGIASVKSLAAHPVLSMPEPDSDQLHALGVVEVYRSDRTTSYYSNFGSSVKQLSGEATHSICIEPGTARPRSRIGSRSVPRSCRARTPPAISCRDTSTPTTTSHVRRRRPPAADAPHRLGAPRLRRRRDRGPRRLATMGGRRLTAPGPTRGLGSAGRFPGAAVRRAGRRLRGLGVGHSLRGAGPRRPTLLAGKRSLRKAIAAGSLRPMGVGAASWARSSRSWPRRRSTPKPSRVVRASPAVGGSSAGGRGPATTATAGRPGRFG